MKRRERATYSVTPTTPEAGGVRCARIRSRTAANFRLTFRGSEFLVLVLLPVQRPVVEPWDADASGSDLLPRFRTAKALSDDFVWDPALSGGVRGRDGADRGGVGSSEGGGGAVDLTESGGVVRGEVGQSQVQPNGP